MRRGGWAGVVPALLAVSALGLGVVGCGADAAEVTSAGSEAREVQAAPDPLAVSLRAADDGSALLVDDGDALHVLDPGTAAERFAAPGAIASGDGSLVVGAEPAGGSTVVAARSVADGSTRWSATVAGPLQVVGVSRGGETVALTDPSAPEGTTSIVVVRFAFASDLTYGDVRPLLSVAVAEAALPSTQRLDVAGRVEFDGFADSTRGIFVLQRSVGDDDAYQVRYLDLIEGSLENMSTRNKVIPEGEMYGRFRSVVHSPARGEIATLYTIPGSGTAGAAFVHLLNTRGNFADCLDVPAPLGRGEPSTLALGAIGPGDPLLVYDSAAGAVASLDPDVLGSVTVFELTDPALGEGRPAAIAATLSQVVVASGERVVVHDLLGTPMGSWSAAGDVTALAVIPGAGTVAAIVDGSVRIFAMDGTVVASAGPDAKVASTEVSPSVATAGPPPAPTASTVAPPASVIDVVPTTIVEPLVVGTIPGTALAPGTSRP